MWLSWTKRESVSPVVKVKGYFAPTEPDAQGSGPAGGSELLGQRRSLEPKSTRRYRAPSRLFSSVPRRGFEIAVLAGGEDYGYFASDAGDAGSNPAMGLMPVWSKRKDT
jgi:hypothetical protein